MILKMIMLLLVLGAGLQAAPVSDRVPAQLGFSGTFSHRSDDRFEFNFSLGQQLTISRKGEIVSLQVGSAKILRDKGNRPLVAVDNQGVLIKLTYNSAGQVAGILTRKGEAFHVAYSREKKLIAIHFPNRQSGSFPVTDKR